MRKVTLRIIALIQGIALIALLGGCYFLPVEEEPLKPPLIEASEITYVTQAVGRGDIETKINKQATFVTAVQESLAYKDISGRISEINVHMGTKVSAGDVLVVIDVSETEKQIRQQNITVEKAQLSVERLEEQLERTRANNPFYTTDEELSDAGLFDFYALEEAKLNLKSAELTLNDLREKVKLGKLTAPFDGQVTWVQDGLQVGTEVRAYDNLIRIVDPSELFLQYEGSDAERFPVGATVQVKADGKVYDAEVTVNPTVLEPDEKGNVASIARFSITDMELVGSMGSTVQIEYITDSRKNVIVIPKSVITSYQGRRYVNILVDGIKQERDIEVGLENSTQAEVVAGLEEGELLIVG